MSGKKIRRNIFVELTKNVSIPRILQRYLNISEFSRKEEASSKIRLPKRIIFLIRAFNLLS